MTDLCQILKKEGLHHFNILEGYSVADVQTVCHEILSFDSVANPNYFYKKYDAFLVDDARELIDLQSRKHGKDQSAVFVMECGSLNIPAQNSLLKVLEDGRHGNYFFILVEQANLLLPTVLSRGVVYRNGGQMTNSLKELQQKSLKDKMAWAEKITSDYKKEKITKTEIRNLVHSIMSEMNQEVLNGDTKMAKTLQNINQVSGYLDFNGSSVKSILEFIVLNI